MLLSRLLVVQWLDTMHSVTLLYYVLCEDVIISLLVRKSLCYIWGHQRSCVCTFKKVSP